MKYLLALCCTALIVALASSPSAAQSSAKPYQVVSSSASELIVRIAPTYWTRTVKDAQTGEPLSRMGFEGGTTPDSAGAPELFRLPLEVLTPDRAPVQVEILSQNLEILSGVSLAPIATYTKKGSDAEPQYRIVQSRYQAISRPLIDLLPSYTSRTAYAQTIQLSPIEYDWRTKTITRVKDLTIRIKFHSSDLRPANLSSTERSLFSGLFVNGNVSEFYRAAVPEITAHVQTAPAFKGAHPLDDGKWLQIETTDEGIYKITSQDLQTAGVTSVDPSTIELFGLGGEIINESLTGTNGEWLERPIDLRSNGQTFTELYFYAKGVANWKYAPGEGANVDGLYHLLNPYAVKGHFLLKVGGSRIGKGLRVLLSPDTLKAPATSSDRVFTSALHEVERIFEVGGSGRELLGETIPRTDAGPLQLSVDLPGYTGDSTTIRVAFDNGIPSNYSGTLSVSTDGSPIANLKCRTSGNGDQGVERNWDNAIRVSPSATSPLKIGLSFSSNNITSPAWLDFIEIMYKRTTDIGKSSIPFMVIDTKSAFNYSFTNADGGAVWDVTNSLAPRILSNANGGTLGVSVQGQAGSMRRFIAYSSQSASTPTIRPLSSAPTLRSTIGQQGAQEIIIAPTDFLAQAEELKKIRQQGGDATEPLSAAVVSIEDIYREFGYGSRDLGAIRDFLSYTFRHTAANGSTVPMYVVFLGSGHSDYLNRVTTIKNYIPSWNIPNSEYLGVMRTQIDEAIPDDGFFERLVPNEAYNHLDIATGRISVRSVDEAEGVVHKIQVYEHASDQGDWRGRATFVADDRAGDDAAIHDGIDHMGDTEQEVRQLQERLDINKIYEVSYPLVYTSLGRRRVGVENSIVDAFNNGSTIISFVGHGNPKVWTHEGILSVPSTINRFSNINRLAYLTTATCDYSRYDTYDDVSGGTQMMIKPDGGAIGMLGTSRSVTGGESLVVVFYQTLFQSIGNFGTSSVGTAFLAGKAVCSSGNLPNYYLLGDPAQRLLVPKLFVNFDAINGTSGSEVQKLSALSQVQVQGSVVESGTSGAATVSNFNGTATITLYDADTRVTAYSTFLNDSPITDEYMVPGPILYKGTASVKNGKFAISFIVPKDIKFDSLSAKLSGIAYAVDGRSALGDTRNLILKGSDSVLSVIDTTGPALNLFIGNRAFRSGDAVSMHSSVLVDVKDLHGLNTSTASIGHSFVAWVDDSTNGAVDLASYFVSKQDDFSTGTSVRPMELPAGHHTLHVRAFDTFDNPSFASVDFVAKKVEPYQLYDVSNYPNPLIDHTTFTLVQPGSAGGLVHVGLRIYATNGDLVRTITQDSRQSSISIVWNGADDAGTRVSNGAYLYQVSANNETDGTSAEAAGRLIVAH